MVPGGTVLLSREQRSHSDSPLPTTSGRGKEDTGRSCCIALHAGKDGNPANGPQTLCITWSLSVSNYGITTSVVFVSLCGFYPWGFEQLPQPVLYKHASTSAGTELYNFSFLSLPTDIFLIFFTFFVLLSSLFFNNTSLMFVVWSISISYDNILLQIFATEV